MVMDRLGSGETSQRYAACISQLRCFNLPLLSVDRGLPGEREPKLGFFSEMPPAGTFCSPLTLQGI